MQYLEFEKPIEELNNKLIQARELADLKDVDASKTINDIENQILKAKKKFTTIFLLGKKYNYQDIQIDHIVWITLML